MHITHILAASAAIVAIGGVADAHPKLVSSSPAANSAVASPSHVDLRFTEQLMPSFSKAELIMPAMPGMGAMKIAGSAAVGADGKSLVIKPKAKLHKGKYVVDWHVVSKDTHKLAGRYAFTVK